MRPRDCVSIHSEKEQGETVLSGSKIVANEKIGSLNPQMANSLIT